MCHVTNSGSGGIISAAELEKPLPTGYLGQVSGRNFSGRGGGSWG